MVAPADTGEHVRSLVRIPGSGQGKAVASTILMDLSRVSSFAAMFPVPTTLPDALATSDSERGPPESKRKGQQSPTTSHQTPQPSVPSAGITGRPPSASPPIARIQARHYVVKRGIAVTVNKPYARPVANVVRINAPAGAVMIVPPSANISGLMPQRAAVVSRLEVLIGALRSQERSQSVDKRSDQ